MPNIAGFFGGEKIGSLIDLCIGVVFLLVCNGLLSWSVMGAIGAFAIGLSIMFGHKGKSKIAKKCEKDYTAIFVGNDSVVEGNLVDSSVCALFGGIDNKCKSNSSVKGKHTIYINGTCAFGAIEIK